MVKKKETREKLPIEKPTQKCKCGQFSIPPWRLKLSKLEEPTCAECNKKILLERKRKRKRIHYKKTKERELEKTTDVQKPVVDIDRVKKYLRHKFSEKTEQEIEELAMMIQEAV